MAIEKYIVKDTENLIHDPEALKAWEDLSKQLGLKGQETLAGGKSPVPYQFMNAKMTRVFEVLCPAKLEITDYDKSPIPVELLQLVSMSDKENHFEKVEVWYDDQGPDPILVGYNGDDRYLIGRWGAELAAMADLYASAYKRKAQEMQVYALDRIEAYKKELRNMPAEVDRWFNRGW